MDFEQLLKLLQNGTIIALFVISFLLFIWKGIPYLIGKVIAIIETIMVQHTQQVENLAKTFEWALKLVTDKFIDQQKAQHDEQMKYHEDHRLQFNEIKTDLEAIKHQSISAGRKR
jgi:cell shape-determining protein MreC